MSGEIHLGKEKVHWDEPYETQAAEEESDFGAPSRVLRGEHQRNHVVPHDLGYVGSGGSQTAGFGAQQGGLDLDEC